VFEARVINLCDRDIATVCASPNQFVEESVLRRSVPRLVCALEHQVHDKSVLQRLTSQTRLCGVGNQFPDEVVRSRETVH